MRRRLRSARGQTLLETALILPLILLVSVAIFEFGRAYQTWEVLTNAAREGARIAVLPNQTAGAVQARVLQYITDGALSTNGVTVTVNSNVPVSMGAAGNASGSQVTVQYPFSFIVLQPVAQLVVRGSLLGTPFNMTAQATMRNETQS